MVEEEENIAIGYITGRISVKLSPPNGIDLDPKINVDGVSAIVKKEGIEVTPTWKYLAVVEAGTHTVSLILGNVTRERRIDSKSGQTARLNFILKETA